VSACCRIPSSRRTVRETAHIGLGSNIGDRAAHIAEAIERIRGLSETRVTAVSSLFETAPVGKTDQPHFLNAVIAAETKLEPEALLTELLRIENSLGRTRVERWGPRVIDLDLLQMGDRTLQTARLTLPHPRMAARPFVLHPLLEISPDLADPISTRPWREILAALPPTDWGRRLPVVADSKP